MTRQRLDDIKESGDISTYDGAIRFLLNKYDMGEFVKRIDKLSSDPIQVAENIDIPDPIIYCSVCGEQVARFRFTDPNNPHLALPPFLDRGVLRCTGEGCEAGHLHDELRYAHHLVGVPSDADAPTEDEIEGTMTEYWDEFLPATEHPDDDRELRVMSWVGIAESNDWSWRPELSIWREFSDLEEIMQSIGSLLEAHHDISTAIISPDANCCSSVGWHFHLERPAKDQSSETDTEGISSIEDDVVDRLRSWLADASADVEASDVEEYHSIVFSGLEDGE